MTKLSNVILLLFIFIPTTSFAFNAKCVGVSDGDTITVLQVTKKEVKVRLYGIDCPEKKQAYGKRAKQFTSSLVFGNTVSVEVKDNDQYGRTVGIVYHGERCLNKELLSNGLAWIYTQYYKGDTWKKLEAEARDAKKGL